MRWLSKLFGRSKVVDSVFDKENGHLKNLGGFIDEQRFTDQEKAVLSYKTAEAYSEFVKDSLAESTERSVTRRELAILVIKFYLLVLFMSIMTYPFNKFWAEYIFSIATKTELAWLVLGIGGFFWGTHLLRSTKLAKDKA